MSIIILFLAIMLALGTTFLFLWGAWELFRQPKRMEKQHAIDTADFSLKRNEGNPLLHPSGYDFEKEAVMNPAAISDGEKTHLFYRAIGSDGVSRIGYASSKDGIHIDERLPYPVFAFEGPDPHLDAMRRAYAHAHYPELIASGGSWGGAEDPRAVLMGDRVYLTFSAFHNWDSVRITTTSIALSDLKKKRWNWSKPVFLSRQNEVHKNWVLFPEKINGMFAILHSISPNVQVAYRKDLGSVGTSEPYIESPRGARTEGRANHWDSWVRGAGPAPVKTDKGWLLFYHATSSEYLYQIGAMLLEKNDPTKVIVRSPIPVLTPNTEYEMGGAKPGVVYACGTAKENDRLTVYYGAADNFVCSATTSLSQFVNKLLKHEPQALSPTVLSMPIGV